MEWVFWKARQQTWVTVTVNYNDLHLYNLDSIILFYIVQRDGIVLRLIFYFQQKLFCNFNMEIPSQTYLL